MNLNINSDNLHVDVETASRSSIESRRSRMSRMTGNMDPPPSPGVPRLPETKLDLSFSLDSFMPPSLFDDSQIDTKKREQVEKRQSNVLKLAQENEKLNAELAAMSERLRAAEARTQALLAARDKNAGSKEATGTSAGQNTKANASVTSKAPAS